MQVVVLNSFLIEIKWRSGGRAALTAPTYIYKKRNATSKTHKTRAVRLRGSCVYILQALLGNRFGLGLFLHCLQGWQEETDTDTETETMTSHGLCFFCVAVQGRKRDRTETELMASHGLGILLHCLECRQRRPMPRPNHGQPWSRYRYVLLLLLRHIIYLFNYYYY